MMNAVSFTLNCHLKDESYDDIIIIHVFLWCRGSYGGGGGGGAVLLTSTDGTGGNTYRCCKDW
jgi:hypothetical protein